MQKFSMHFYHLIQPGTCGNFSFTFSECLLVYIKNKNLIKIVDTSFIDKSQQEKKGFIIISLIIQASS